jgi:hypothetical protein
MRIQKTRWVRVRRVFKVRNFRTRTCLRTRTRTSEKLWLQIYVLFICKTKSRLRRRHCGLARHFKTDPTETVALCFGYAKTLFWRQRHCGLARHFKTDPTKTVALCFGYAKTLCWRADGRADEQDNWRLALYTCKDECVIIIRLTRGLFLSFI